ncbi:hypothetical protein ES705_51193 [subsurface metagenome]
MAITGTNIGVLKSDLLNCFGDILSLDAKASPFSGGHEKLNLFTVLGLISCSVSESNSDFLSESRLERVLNHVSSGVNSLLPSGVITGPHSSSPESWISMMRASPSFASAPVLGISTGLSEKGWKFTAICPAEPIRPVSFSP